MLQLTEEIPKFSVCYSYNCKRIRLFAAQSNDVYVMWYNAVLDYILCNNDNNKKKIIIINKKIK